MVFGVGVIGRVGVGVGVCGWRWWVVKGGVVGDGRTVKKWWWVV